MKAVTELSKAINEICPQIPLFLKNNIRAYNSKLQGFNLTSNGMTRYEKMYWAE